MSENAGSTRSRPSGARRAGRQAMHGRSRGGNRLSESEADMIELNINYWQTLLLSSASPRSQIDNSQRST